MKIKIDDRVFDNVSRIEISKEPKTIPFTRVAVFLDHNFYDKNTQTHGVYRQETGYQIEVDEEEGEGYVER
jgi:hypothetical protein